MSNRISAPEKNLKSRNKYISCKFYLQMLRNCCIFAAEKLRREHQGPGAMSAIFQPKQNTGIVALFNFFNSRDKVFSSDQRL